MFDSFKSAWRQAVDNFWVEMEAGDSAVDARVRAGYRQIAAARSQVERLERDIEECRVARDHEHEQAQVCSRREQMARQIGDVETARVATDFRVRHEERAGVLARKLEALQAEHALCRRDLAEMERAMAVAAGPLRPEIDDLNRHPNEPDFQTLERAARERAAAERLEELKRRHGG
jgi:hypothetical protein